MRLTTRTRTSLRVSRRRNGRRPWAPDRLWGRRREEALAAHLEALGCQVWPLGLENLLPDEAVEAYAHGKLQIPRELAVLPDLLVQAKDGRWFWCEAKRLRDGRGTVNEENFQVQRRLYRPLILSFIDLKAKNYISLSVEAVEKRTLAVAGRGRRRYRLVDLTDLELKDLASKEVADDGKTKGEAGQSRG